MDNTIKNILDNSLTSDEKEFFLTIASYIDDETENATYTDFKEILEEIEDLQTISQISKIPYGFCYTLYDNFQSLFRDDILAIDIEKHVNNRFFEMSSFLNEKVMEIENLYEEIFLNNQSEYIKKLFVALESIFLESYKEQDKEKEFNIISFVDKLDIIKNGTMDDADIFLKYETINKVFEEWEIELTDFLEEEAFQTGTENDLNFLSIHLKLNTYDLFRNNGINAKDTIIKAFIYSTCCSLEEEINQFLNQINQKEIA